MAQKAVIVVTGGLVQEVFYDGEPMEFIVVDMDVKAVQFPEYVQAPEMVEHYEAMVHRGELAVD